MSYVNRGSVLAIGITFTITSITAVATRFAVRLRHDGLAVDDWLCLAALPLVLGCCCTMIVGFANDSLGNHSPPGQPPYASGLLVRTKKLEYVIYMLFVPALLLMKLSTLFFYRRIFRGRAFQISFWILCIFSVLWGITFFTAWAAACSNVEYFWTAVQEKCADTFKILLLQSIFDVIVDLAILILPMPFIFRLQMPLRRKIGASCTLAVGALAIGCGIYRMAIFIEALAVPFLSTPTVANLPSDDFNGVVTALCIWSMLELGVAMVAICLPTLRPILRFQKLESLTNSLRSMMSSHSSRSSSSSTIHKSLPNSTVHTHTAGSVTADEKGLDDIYRRTKGLSTASATYDARASESTHGNEENDTVPKSNEIMVKRTVDLSTFSHV